MARPPRAQGGTFVRQLDHEYVVKVLSAPGAPTPLELAQRLGCTRSMIYRIRSDAKKAERKRQWENRNHWTREVVIAKVREWVEWAERFPIGDPEWDREARAGRLPHRRYLRQYGISRTELREQLRKELNLPLERHWPGQAP